MRIDDDTRDDAPAQDEESVDGPISDAHQYVTFVVGAELFAVDMTPVQEIIRVPDVVRVPMAPPSLDGLANLRGKVLPIISLRRIFGFDDQMNDDATRALVIDIGQPLGFVVDKVVSVVGVESAKIESAASIEGTVKSELLAGIIKDIGGHPMIMVLDFTKLIAQEFAEVAAVARRGSVGGGRAANVETDDDAANDELQLVSFGVAGQEYAFAIDDVQEIVQLPEQIVHVPRSESHVLGVMTLRNRLLPLVSLRRMFALPAHAANDQSRILVVSAGGSAVGIVVDSVNEVLRVARVDVDAMPGLFAREGSLKDIAQICRLDGGNRLVSIISAQNLFRLSAIEDALTAVNQLSDETEHDDRDHHESRDDDEQVVVFRLDKEEFGVPIASVQEIVRVPDTLTHIPGAPSYVEGVINLRGAVLPVIDLRRRLGLPSVERTDGQRVVVFLIKGMRTGFIVDSVAEVLTISKSAIEPTPQLSGQHGQLLARMANLEKQKRLVQLIAPAHLIEDREVADLTMLAA